MKVCSQCLNEKLESEFDYKLGKLRSNCKSCVSVYTRRHYLLNKGYYSEKAKKNRNISRNRLRDYLLQYYQLHPCVDCGECDPVVLEFDHLRDKTYAISQMITRAVSLKRLGEEISKCDVVCANCHKRRTAKRSGWYKLV